MPEKRRRTHRWLGLSRQASRLGTGIRLLGRLRNGGRNPSGARPSRRWRWVGDSFGLGEGGQIRVLRVGYF